MRASFDLLTMTLLLIGSKQRLATIVALQANLDSQWLTAVLRHTFINTSAIPLRREPLPRQPVHWRAAELIATFREA